MQIKKLKVSVFSIIGTLIFCLLITVSCSTQTAITTSKEEKDYRELLELEPKIVNDNLTLNKDYARRLQLSAQYFLATYPHSQYTEKVLVFVAKTADGLEQHELVLQTLNRLLDEFPYSEDAPIYLYNKGKIYEEKLKDVHRAKQVYQTLIDAYPDSKIAQDIKYYLNYLEKE